MLAKPTLCFEVDPCVLLWSYSLLLFLISSWLASHLLAWSLEQPSFTMMGEEWLAAKVPWTDCLRTGAGLRVWPPLCIELSRNVAHNARMAKPARSDDRWAHTPAHTRTSVRFRDKGTLCSLSLCSQVCDASRTDRGLRRTPHTASCTWLTSPPVWIQTGCWHPLSQHWATWWFSKALTSDSGTRSQFFSHWRSPRFSGTGQNPAPPPKP